MRIALGNRGDYAVRAVLDLALAYGEGRRKSRQIAAAMEIPERFLPQIMGDLVRAGIVESVAGPDGGYSLTRPPEEVTLLEVVEVAEGPLRSERCVLSGGPCHWDNACAVHPEWAKAQEAFITSLAGSTFADMVTTDRALASGVRIR